MLVTILDTIDTIDTRYNARYKTRYKTRYKALALSSDSYIHIILSFNAKGKIVTRFFMMYQLKHVKITTCQDMDKP